MTLPEIVIGVMWIGVTLYAVFAGADFGGGVWDLLAGRSGPGDSQRRLIEHSIGPVWEANHVWLIFVLVVLWTGFPVAFAAIMSSLYVHSPPRHSGSSCAEPASRSASPSQTSHRDACSAWPLRSPR